MRVKWHFLFLESLSLPFQFLFILNQPFDGAVGNCPFSDLLYLSPFIPLCASQGLFRKQKPHGNLNKENLI